MTQAQKLFFTFYQDYVVYSTVSTVHSSEADLQLPVFYCPL